MERFFVKKVFGMIGVLFLLGFNSAHSGLLAPRGSEPFLNDCTTVETDCRPKIEDQAVKGDGVSTTPAGADGRSNFARKEAGGAGMSPVDPDRLPAGGFLPPPVLHWIRTTPYEEAADAQSLFKGVQAGLGGTVGSESTDTVVSGDFSGNIFELFLDSSRFSRSDRAAIAEWRAEQTETENSGSDSSAGVSDDGIKLAGPLRDTIWLLVCGLIGFVALRRKFKH